MAGSLLSAPKEIRGRWYLQTDKYGKAVMENCSIFGMSRKIYYKWYNRDHGLIKSSKYRPRKIHPHTKLTFQIKKIIQEAKIKYNYGPKKMKFWLEKNHQIQVSSTTI
ncbi:hypothetical protein COT97_05800, partial [Candidatus Falkowbacteria bacterium CG10_big_fil_rev_8_21_14_0_10_39_11]